METERLSSESQSPSPEQLGKSSTPIWVVPLALLVGAAVVAAVVGAVVLILSLARTMPVTLVVDGEAREIETRAGSVAQLLDDVQVALNDGDAITPPLGAMLGAGDVVRIKRARSVFLTVDGTTTPLWTPLDNPAEILAMSGVRVSENDRVMIDGTEAEPAALAMWSVPVSNIVVRHAVTLTVYDDGDDTTRTVQTTGATVGEALFEAGITLYLTDTTVPDLNAPLTRDLEVRITRARPVEIIADGATVRTRSRGATVADALADADVVLVGQDYAIPDERAALRPGMSIRVIRVREELEAEQEEIPFGIVYQASAELELDQQQTVQQGQRGLRETRFRVRYENGIPVQRTQEETVVVREAMNTIINYGTNVVIRTIDTPEGPREYWRVLRMYITSYHPAALGGDNITATGRTLQHGIVGSDPKVLPYGTQIYVRNYGVGDVQDTGGPRSMKFWIDLGYSDEDWRGWAGYADVYILTPVPAEIDYMLNIS